MRAAGMEARVIRTASGVANPFVAVTDVAVTRSTRARAETAAPRRFTRARRGRSRSVFTALRKICRYLNAWRGRMSRCAFGGGPGLGCGRRSPIEEVVFGLCDACVTNFSRSTFAARAPVVVDGARNKTRRIEGSTFAPRASFVCEAISHWKKCPIWSAQTTYG